MLTALKRVVVFVLACGVCQFAHSQKTPAIPAETQQHIGDVETGLRPSVILNDDPHPTHSLSERMTTLHVPGVSIAVIHHGVIEWAQGFGATSLNGPAVTAETLFQAGSISKPLAAMAALHQVQLGKFSLDADVNTVLTSWKLPDASVAGGKTVTLRELLTHTGGTTVHGFPGYASDAPVPTLVQVLNGEKPANTPAIRIEAAPGSHWNYSGGGYTIMQQMLIDAMKEPFPKLLHDTVLAPIGMTHSTYQQPLPVDMRAMAATPYEADGKPVAGGAHTYPEMAAAGLWTTPSDLARYLIEVQRSLKGEANHVLSQQMTKEMLTPGMGQYGLGLAIGGAAGKPYFGHGGVNDGFESTMTAYEQDGEGAVVMTNAQGGMRLADEVMRSIATAYHWPDFQPKIRAAVTVDPKILASYAGTYELSPTFGIVVTVEDGHLMTQGSGQGKVPMLAESETKFFPTAFDAELEFYKDELGHVSYAMLRQNGHETKALRR
ncbi:MAG TPA: serine hydrolase [Edaphobacter sp.]|nr:serine hydrolase [Edaphobacter sp.]